MQVMRKTTGVMNDPGVKSVDEIIGMFDRWINEYHSRVDNCIGGIHTNLHELISNSRVSEPSENSAEILGLETHATQFVENCKDLFLLIQELKQHALLQKPTLQAAR
ncbi:Mediator complex, subunit Med22 [Carpediemonas membranifera]|uniref:Mediator complex, subunit Med22 n=1 Tax=Carpediemonas membranifera TaxID=201153 RepID=A0A8J6E1R8_9EUKA|nr:Mediator complex, subunit Med22 [Carpediemonas membranifera]|eukprot:KAG9396714.1 Mediator complex, subunit Med22 [Carpediemonas membranifera]